MPLADEFENGLADPADAARLVEIGGEIAPLDDRQQELMELDGLQVVEAEAVGRRREEGAVMRMGAVDADGLETLLRPPARRWR